LETKEKVSDFIERHTLETDGKKQINVVSIVVELHARIIALQNQLKEVNKAFGDFGAHALQINERVEKLEGKKTIEVVSGDVLDKLGNGGGL